MSREWFDKIGELIVITVVVNIFFPYLAKLLLVVPYRKLKRCIYRKFTKSLYKLVKKYRGPKFNIASHLSNILLFVTTSVIFSPGIPLLNIICLVVLIIAYWVDKFLVLRYYRKPPFYSDSINLRIIFLFYLCIPIRSIFLCTSFTCKDIFPVDVEYNKCSKKCVKKVSNSILIVLL